MFGRGPYLSLFHGHSTYTTGLGTFFTLGAEIVVIMYIVRTFQSLVDNTSPTITSLSEYNIDKTEYSLLEAGGSSDILPTFAIIDPVSQGLVRFQDQLQYATLVGEYSDLEDPGAPT